MSSIGIGECDCDYGGKKAKLSISALTGGWGCGEDNTPLSVSISIHPEDESKDTELIFLTSRQLADLISQMQIANETVKYSWEDIGSEKLKDMDVHFIPPFQWELDEMEKERQTKLEAQKTHEELINNPANRHCASCRYYDKVSWVCAKHFTEQREELTILMRDVEHYSETRARRMELSHVHKNKPEDTCEDWVDAKGAGVIHISED